MKLLVFLIAMMLSFSACSPATANSVASSAPTEQPLSTSTEISEELSIATEQAKAAAVQTEAALTLAAQPTFTPIPTLTSTLANLPTLTPIANSTPAQVGAFFDVPPDVLGPRYVIENACYFDTQSGWERYEIYAGAVAGTGDDYSAQGAVVVHHLRVMEQEGQIQVELVDTKEHLTSKKLGPLRLPTFGNCGDQSILLTTPLNFSWFLDGSAEFYQYEGLVPFARLQVGDQTQLAGVGSYCWKGGCADGAAISTSSQPLIMGSSGIAHLVLPVAEPPDGLSFSTMLVSPLGVLRGDPAYDYVGPETASWSYEKPGRELLDQGKLLLRREQDIKLSLGPGPGYYALTILAVWHDYGDVEYGFLIEVPK